MGFCCTQVRQANKITWSALSKSRIPGVKGTLRLALSFFEEKYERSAEFQGPERLVTLYLCLSSIHSLLWCAKLCYFALSNDAYYNRITKLDHILT